MLNAVPNWRVVLVALLVSLMVSAARAAQDAPPLLPVEQFYRHPDIGAASLSPSGRLLAVTTGIGGARVGLAVFDLQQGNTPTVAARFGDADIRSFRWVNDERLVFDLIDLASGGGDQRIAHGLYSVKVDGTELRQLVRLSRDFAVDRRVDREPLAWNHELLAVPAGGGNEVIVGRVDFNNAGQPEQVLPLLLDVTTQRTQSLALNAPDHVYQWLFDPRGAPRVAIARQAGQLRVHWRAPEKTQWEEIAAFPALEPAFVPAFVDAAGQLFVTTADAATGQNVLKRFDFATRKPQAQALVSTPGFDFDGTMIAEDSSADQALGVRVETDAETTVWFDARLRRIQQAADAHYPGLINRLSCRKCQSDDAVVLVRSWSDREPGLYSLYVPGRDRWQVVGRVRQDIDPRRMATLDFFRFKARDGLDIPVWITRPAGSDPRKALPAVVLVHGGPWVRGGSWQWHADAQFLASRGYLVIEPEFRGSTGFGTALFRAGWKQWGQAMQDDVADAVTWATRQGWVDPRRVCIAGASYGGYATLMGLIRQPELYRCGMAWVAVTDPRLLFQLDWVNDVSDEAKRFDLPTMLGDPKADAALLAGVAPVELAGRIKSPLLLAFGGEDRRVPLEHGARMRAALRSAGQDPEWVVYPDEGHGWLRVENRIDFARRMERFLGQHLQ